MKTSRKYPKYINVLVFIAALCLVTFLGTDPAAGEIQLDLRNEKLSISGPDDFTYAIPFSEIREIDRLDDFSEPGEPVEGAQTKKAWYGTWENSEFGRYTLAVSPTVSLYLKIRTSAGEIVILNYESEAATESLYEALSSL